MLILTYSITRSIVVPLHVYFICSMNLQCMRAIRNKVLWIQPHIILGFFLTVPVLIRLIIWIIPFNTLVYPSYRESTCLEITNIFITVPSTCISSYLRHLFIKLLGGYTHSIICNIYCRLLNLTWNWTIHV